MSKLLRMLMALTWSISLAASPTKYDIVVYGGSSAGVVAAVQAARMGKSVVLIEPTQHLGGMTSSGLGFVDVSKPAYIGGVTAEFFRRVRDHYQRDDAWRFEKKTTIPDQNSQFPKNDGMQFTLEPHVAEAIFERMLQETSVVVVRGQRLNRSAGVEKHGGKIFSIAMESGAMFAGRMFIDATYEGDLMAAAGVTYTVGREARSLYEEEMNGIVINTPRTNLPSHIDPYIVKGQPESGLLPRIYAGSLGNEGEGDRSVQAFNYRLVLTDLPENRITIEKPANYDEREYELLFRTLSVGVDKRNFFKRDRLPNRKIDANHNGPVSMDYVGMSFDYAEADYEKRRQMEMAHENWQRGLLWTLQSHPRIPKKLRDYFAVWGLAKDEFVDNNNWPHQLYVREGRRMVSNVVITEQVALGKIKHEDAVGLGSYHIDSHAIKYFVAEDGFLMTDGCLFKKLESPYKISYRAMVPKKEECRNLFVPVCLSATHVAYGSIRMEPVLMILGQSAATAASVSIDKGVSPADLPYKTLEKRLLADGQVLK